MSDYKDLCGWMGEDKILLKEAQDATPTHLQQPLVIYGATAPKRTMLFEVAKKVLGGFPDTGEQLIGDCVSWGGHKHSIEYLELMQMAMGSLEEFKYIFSPYGYGCGRIFIGGGGGWGDGSVGVWQAQANVKYGSVSIDLEGLPQYSASIAKQFGRSSSTVQQWVDKGKIHLVKSSAKVTTWDQLVDSINNLYPVAVCSNVGYTMQQQSDGFHHRSGTWGHCMCIVGVDPEYSDPYACILNSWGDVHGKVIDFTNKQEWPKGTLRVRKADIERMLSQDDSFAYSGYNGFPAQKLPDNFFDMI